MATAFYYLTGKAKWARLFTPDEKYKNYKIDLLLDAESKKKFAESGMTMTPKMAEEGEYITFRRPEAKLIKNELVKFEAPPVTDAEGKPVEKLIGNGSDVTVKVVVYDTVKGKGHRLEAVRVNSLIEYQKPDDSMPAATAAAATEAAPKAARKAMPF
jgi:hypothetical protein